MASLWAILVWQQSAAPPPAGGGDRRDALLARLAGDAAVRAAAAVRYLVSQQSDVDPQTGLLTVAGLVVFRQSKLEMHAGAGGEEGSGYVEFDVDCVADVDAGRVQLLAAAVAACLAADPGPPQTAPWVGQGYRLDENDEVLAALVNPDDYRFQTTQTWRMPFIDA